MNPEILKAINSIGGLGEFKRSRKKFWDEQDKSLEEDINQLIDLPNYICLRHLEIPTTLKRDSKIKRFIDQNLIDEAESLHESYEDILFRVLNNYLELKKEASK